MSILRCALTALAVAAQPLAVKPVAELDKVVAEAAHGRPLVVHFWASWCGACREEFPSLRKTLNALPGEGTSVLLVSIDAPKDLAAAQEMLEQSGLAGLPAVLLDAPSPDPVAKVMREPRWTGSLPATFVFDAAGAKVKSFIGSASPARLRRAVRRAKRLSRPSAATPPPGPRSD